jgi:hypothetical protein
MDATVPVECVDSGKRRAGVAVADADAQELSTVVVTVTVPSGPVPGTVIR